MNSTNWDIDAEKLPINPVTQTPKSRQENLEDKLKYHYPRHISQNQPQPRAIAPNSNIPEKKVNSYTEVEQRNLCPRLNYYQPATNILTETTTAHLANIRQNLEKRIKTAQLTDNSELVALLAEEWLELGLNSPN